MSQLIYDNRNLQTPELQQFSQQMISMHPVEISATDFTLLQNSNLRNHDQNDRELQNLSNLSQSFYNDRKYQHGKNEFNEIQNISQFQQNVKIQNRNNQKRDEIADNQIQDFKRNEKGKFKINLQLIKPIDKENQEFQQVENKTATSYQQDFKNQFQQYNLNSTSNKQSSRNKAIKGMYQHVNPLSPNVGFATANNDQIFSENHLDPFNESMKLTTQNTLNSGTSKGCSGFGINKTFDFGTRLKYQNQEPILKSSTKYGMLPIQDKERLSKNGLKEANHNIFNFDDKNENFHEFEDSLMPGAFQQKYQDKQEHNEQIGGANNYQIAQGLDNQRQQNQTRSQSLSNQYRSNNQNHPNLNNQNELSSDIQGQVRTKRQGLLQRLENLKSTLDTCFLQQELQGGSFLNSNYKDGQKEFQLDSPTILQYNVLKDHQDIVQKLNYKGQTPVQQQNLQKKDIFTSYNEEKEQSPYEIPIDEQFINHVDFHQDIQHQSQSNNFNQQQQKQKIKVQDKQKSNFQLQQTTQDDLSYLRHEILELNKELCLKDNQLEQKNDQIKDLKLKNEQLESAMKLKDKKILYLLDQNKSFEHENQQAQMQIKLNNELQDKVQYLEKRNSDLIKQLQLKQEEVDNIKSELMIYNDSDKFMIRQLSQASSNMTKKQENSPIAKHRVLAKNELKITYIAQTIFQVNSQYFSIKISIKTFFVLQNSGS
eukprot:403344009